MITNVQWEKARQWLQPALDRGGNTHTTDDIRAGIISGSFQFWTSEKSAAITEIVSYPCSKGCRVFLAGGDMTELLAMQPELEAWAQSIGCKFIEIDGRPGWERIHKDFKKQSVVLRKALS
ncbi:hypothetical protein [Kiloniella antarctica]|uniref:Uncharacterized protein n=1 Tax=Kiloniella antarctica TaxID=1550907 RepID=A0ABW5BNR4_9PROT